MHASPLGEAIQWQDSIRNRKLPKCRQGRCWHTTRYLSSQ